MLLQSVAPQDYYSPPFWQVLIWIVNVLFFLLVSFVGFWFKSLLAEIKNDLKEIKEEMKRGAINFNSNNIKIAELENKVTKIESDVKSIEKRQDLCNYCNEKK
jgi:type III secretory pathway component EscU